jgi:hypothetical protein
MREHHGGSEPERPRFEPEILPPDRPDPWTERERIWVRVEGGSRTFGPMPSALALLLALLAGGLTFAVILLILLGAVLFVVPAVIVALLAIIVAGSLRSRWRRLFRR